MVNKTIFIFFILFLISCGDDNFKKYATLSEFRVLGIVSDLPEVNDTEVEISIRPIISDVNGNGRKINLKIEGCIDPGIATGEEINCDGGQKYALFFQEEIDLAVAFPDSVYTGALPNINLTLPAGILDNRSVFEQFNGIDYLLIFNFSSGDEVSLQSFKRIKVSTRVDKNVNPTITEMGNVTLIKGEQNLSITTNSEPESFLFYDLTGTISTGNEVFYLSWFSSFGEIENSQVYSNEVTKINLESDPPEEGVLLVMLRDGRGGMDFLVKKLPE